MIYNIRGIKLEFELLEAENAELFEELSQKVLEDVRLSENETSLSNKIKVQCNAVIDFFESLFGEDAGYEIFGDSCNYRVCMEAYRDFIKAIEKEKAELEDISDEIKNFGTLVPIKNREQRRIERRR